MTTRRVHLPPEIVIGDGLAPDDRRRLTETILAALDRAVAGFGSTRPADRSLRPDAREPLHQRRIGPDGDTYAVPSYDRAGAHVRLPLDAPGFDWLDRTLGITVVPLHDIRARIDRIMKRPGAMASQARLAYRTDPRAARASLDGSHFRDDDERLSYAYGYFHADLATHGPVDAVELFGTLLAYEVAVQNKISGQIVVSDPPTASDQLALDRLRAQRRAAVAQQRAAADAERVRQELARTPGDISGSPDPAAGGPYVNQGIVLPYHKLVGHPKPREGYDSDEVRLLLRDPRRFEQLYFDATHGVGKAAWLVVEFENHVRAEGRKAAHDTDITTGRGLVHAFLGTGGSDFGRLGLSPHTASGKRMLRVYTEALTEESHDVTFTNTVYANLLNLLLAAKTATAALAKVPPPEAPVQPPPRPRFNTDDVAIIEESTVQPGTVLRGGSGARGTAGEQSMGFAFPREQGWAFLEGPSGAAGHPSNLRGFDGVAFRTTGPHEVHILDNKSLARGGNVSSATAITDNLGRNLGDLARRAADPIFDSVPRIQDVRTSIAQARQAVANGTPLPPDVRLTVTNASGQSTGVTAGLAQQGVQFLDIQ